MEELLTTQTKMSQDKKVENVDLSTEMYLLTFWMIENVIYTVEGAIGVEVFY